MNTEHLNPGSEAIAHRLATDGDYRVLRSVPRPYFDAPKGAPPDARCIALIDLETTGLDPASDRIMELAIMLVWVDENGEVLNHAAPRIWQEDPGVMIDTRITWLTGLANHHLIGKSIPDETVVAMLDRADLLVAHNASFEIAWLERRYPQLAGAAWGCSMKDIDWLRAGMDGRAQQWLLAQEGWHSTAHRAGDDVWSLFWLLQQRRSGWGADPERTHFKRLLEGTDRNTTLVRATGSPIGKKDLLKARQYRWNAGASVWEKEIEPELVDHERAWFYRSGLPEPTLSPMTAHERHR
ncbi:exonuclease domain-containing protein [Altererythrobacter sp. CAU 1778]